MTISKKIKIKKKILDALKDKAELSTDKGDFISTKTKLSNKDRKHSGRYTPRLSGKQKISEMIEKAEEPKEEYNDWSNYRDSFRDRTKIENPNVFHDEDDKEKVRKRNKKIKKQLAIRKARKEKKEVELK